MFAFVPDVAGVIPGLAPHIGFERFSVGCGDTQPTDTDTRSLWPFDGFALVTASFDLYPLKANPIAPNLINIQ